MLPPVQTRYGRLAWSRLPSARASPKPTQPLLPSATPSRCPLPHRSPSLPLAVAVFVCRDQHLMPTTCHLNLAALVILCCPLLLFSSSLLRRVRSRTHPPMELFSSQCPRRPSHTPPCLDIPPFRNKGLIPKANIPLTSAISSLFCVPCPPPRSPLLLLTHALPLSLMQADR